MSLLVIQLPPRTRLSARGGAAELAAPAGHAVPALAYVLSADGLQVTRTGQATPATLPRARSVVLMLDDADVAWHRIDIPRAPPTRLRAALAGVLEERLLEDEDQLHFALGAGAVPGQPGWVAVTHKATLRSTLAALAAAGLDAEHVLPASRPTRAGEAWQGRFTVPATTAAAAPVLGEGPEAPATAQGLVDAAPGEGGDQPCAVLAGPDGVVIVRLQGALARVLLPGEDTPVRWTASPAAAAAAEAWLGAPVAVERDAERLLALARAALAPGAVADNLLQFDLAPRRRGTRAVSAGLQSLFSPRWRPVRWGLAALVGVQLLGLNAYAWQQRQALQDKRQAMAQLLRDTHPGVRAVLDPALQMQRETERLRARAGRAGDADLEALLSAAAAAWPDGQGPVQTLRYESGRLTLLTPGWSPQDIAGFQQRLQGGGYMAQSAGGGLVLSRAAARG